MLSPPLLRPLGVKESGAIGAIRYYVSFRITGEPWSAELLRQALRLLQTRHPLLRACVRDGNFVVTPREIGVQILPGPIAADAVPTLPAAVVAEVPGDDDPPVEIYLLEAEPAPRGENTTDGAARCCELILALQHRVFDGGAGLIFLTELLEILAAIEIGAPVQERLLAPLEVTPPIETLPDWSRWRPSFPAEETASYRPLTTPGEVVSLHSVTLDPYYLKLIEKRGRQWGVSFVAVCNALTVAAYGDAYVELHPDASPPGIRWWVPWDCRRQFPRFAPAIGDLTSGMEYWFSLPASVAQHARRFTAQTLRSRETQAYFQEIAGFLGIIPTIPWRHQVTMFGMAKLSLGTGGRQVTDFHASLPAVFCPGGLFTLVVAALPRKPLFRIDVISNYAPEAVARVIDAWQRRLGELV